MKSETANETRLGGPGVSAPLSQIRIHNFKSVGDATVDLRPLTVVVGRNSSGKSTLLQTVLALVQAIRGHSDSERFPLNGDLVRLGTFDELLTFQVADRSTPVSLGFTLSAPARRAGLSPHRSPKLADISWDSWLSAPAATSAGFAEIRRAMYRVEITSEGPRPGVLELDAEIQPRDPAAIEDVVGRRLVPVVGAVRDYRKFSNDKAVSPVVDFLELQGTLPVSGFRRRQRFEVLWRAWWDAYETVLREQIDQAKQAVVERWRTQEGPARLDRSAVNRAADDLRHTVEQEDRRQLVLGGAGRLRRMVRRQSVEQVFISSALALDTRSAKRLAKSMAELTEYRFRELLHGKLAREPWIDDEINDEISGDTGVDLDQASSVVEAFFRRVRYLGPLRELPKLLYSPGPDQVDLGTRGEFAAAVLHSQGDRIVRVPVPVGSDVQLISGTNEASLPLRHALTLWLRQLSLVNNVMTEDLGRLGISLTVRPFHLDRDVDTTSVGVGVSQALPVVLLCLMAEAGTAVLIEQPELHLHPAMQLELADFLLACAATGRQILVESHSEHLVNRLRYQVAADHTEQVAPLVGLLFAEQDDHGITTYRTSSINEYGGLNADWPKGFLNVGADEAARLLRKNLARKIAESGEDS